MNTTTPNKSGRSRLAGGLTSMAMLTAACLGGSLSAQAQTTVTIDPTASWIGYMNVSEVPANGGGYVFGSGWGPADLNASFSGTTLTVTPNTSIDRDVPNDAFWWAGGAGGAPNKQMDASMYVEDSSTLPGQTVTFAGTVLANTLVSDYTSVAFIKDFAPDYSSYTTITAPLTPGAFSISLPTTPGTHVQYGIETVGPDARRATVATLGLAQIGPAVVVPPPFSASILSGSKVSWTASGANSYQPQKSEDHTTWTNFTAAISGNSLTSLFDAPKSAFYRVLEVTPGSVGNVVLDPGFETTAATALGAANWNILAGAGASIFVTNQYGALNAHSGSTLLYIESSTPASGPVTPPSSDVRSDMIPVTAGTPYALTFYAANPVKVGGANPQYSVFFYNAGNGAVGGPIFTSFASAGSAWTLVSNTITPPTGATQMTIGWIQAMGAGNGWDWVTLIDDVSLSSGPASSGSTNTLTATVQPAVGITWPSVVGKSYTVKTSPTAGPSAVWTSLGANVTGTGTNTVTDLLTNQTQFYRVLQNN